MKKINKIYRKMMKILIIGDLHGLTPKIHFKEFDAIIVPGDFCLDKEIRKYVMMSYKAFIANPVDYKEWWELTGKKKAKRFVDNSINRGRNILQKLNSFNVPVYVIPGNWDLAIKEKGWKYVDKNLYREFIIKGLPNVKDVHSKIIKIDGYNIIGYGLVNGPELLKYRDYKNIPKDRYKKNVENYKKLSSKYNKLFRKAKLPVIFITHNVPYNTPLDIIVNKSNPMNGYHYGSNLARDMIEKHKPLICIGAHMHEHYGTCKIGKTVVLNAGYGGEKNTLLELENGKLRSINFHGKKK